MTDGRRFRNRAADPAARQIAGLGPRSARRAALVLLKKRELLLEPLAAAMRDAAAAIKTCEICGNLDTAFALRALPRSAARSASSVVVEDVADLWALERAGVFRGRYHVLGGALSALDGVTPERLNVALASGAGEEGVEEVILAMNATVEGQTTAHYLMDMLGRSESHAPGPWRAGRRRTRLSRRRHALRCLQGPPRALARSFCALGSSRVLTGIRPLRATLLPRSQNPSRYYLILPGVKARPDISRG